jgi:hypothetical protein
MAPPSSQDHESAVGPPQRVCEGIVCDPEVHILSSSYLTTTRLDCHILLPSGFSQTRQGGLPWIVSPSILPIEHDPVDSPTRDKLWTSLTQLQQCHTLPLTDTSIRADRKIVIPRIARRAHRHMTRLSGRVVLPAATLIAVYFSQVNPAPDEEFRFPGGSRASGLNGIPDFVVNLRADVHIV